MKLKTEKTKVFCPRCGSDQIELATVSQEVLLYFFKNRPIAEKRSGKCKSCGEFWFFDHSVLPRFLVKIIMASKNAVFMTLIIAAFLTLFLNGLFLLSKFLFQLAGE